VKPRSNASIEILLVGRADEVFVEIATWAAVVGAAAGGNVQTGAPALAQPVRASVTLTMMAKRGRKRRILALLDDFAKVIG